MNDSKRSRRVFELLGDIDDRFIEEAAPSGRRKSRSVLKYIAGAAAAAAAVIIWQTGLFGKPIIFDDPPTSGVQFIDYQKLPFDYRGNPTELKKLNPEVYVDGMGGGFGDFYTEEELEEISNSNSWKKSYQYTELPVFKVRGSTRYSGMKPFSFTDAELMSKLENAAKVLGEELTDIKKEYFQEGQIAPEDYEVLKDCPISIDAMAGGDIRLRIYSDGDLSIYFGELYGDRFGEPVKIPENRLDDPMSWVIEKYSGLFGYDNPQHCGSDIKNQPDDLFSDFICGNFNSAYARFDGDSLLEINVDNELETLSCEGFYPAITWQEAQNLLTSGEFVNTQYESDKYTGFEESAVKAVTLTYRYNENRGCALPYYLFMVEVPDKLGRTAEGEYHCIPFYVPAVKPEFLETAEENALF